MSIIKILNINIFYQLNLLVDTLSTKIFTVNKNSKKYLLIKIFIQTKISDL